MKVRKFRNILATALTLVMMPALLSCDNKGSHAEVFAEIDRMCDTEPEKAISMLDSIDYGSLSEKERHHYDLLHIKTRDKSYVRHTSDSLILDVIDYYSDHKDNDLYPEALYYGGRVYSDLGDLPSALDYFQKALDEIPDNQENLRFKANVLSQTGRVLDDLRMFSQAIPYMEKSIEISRKTGNKFSLTFDCILLGGIYIHLSDYGNAEKYISEALEHSSLLARSDQAIVMSYRAEVLYYENKIDSALNVIRHLPNEIDMEFQGQPMAIAAKTYLAAGITDTAYTYAKRLAFNYQPHYRIVGFSLLFDDRLKKYIPKDSLDEYYNLYNKYIEHNLDTHDAQEALVSNSIYNYKQHDSKRLKAEETTVRSKSLLSIACIMCMAALTILIYLYYRKKQVQEQRDKSMERLEVTESVLNRLTRKNDTITKTIDRIRIENEKLQDSLFDTRLMPSFNAKIYNNLRQKILDRFKGTEYGNDNGILAESLYKSSTYRHLVEMIDKNRNITDTNFWPELGNEIEKSSPDFKYKLQILTKGTMTDTDFQMALLIRCHVSPGNSAIILGIRKNSVSSRRLSLASKIFDNPTDRKSLDMLIRSL